MEETYLSLSTTHLRPATVAVMCLPVFIFRPVIFTVVPPDLGPFLGLKSIGSGIYR